MPFDISTEHEFSASHQLRLYDQSLEPLHGHNWLIRVTVTADSLDPIGVVMDFHELERLVEAIVRPMHNRHLNEVPPFDASMNPTAENVATYVGQALRLPEAVTLASVEAYETANCRAVFRP